MITVGSVIGSGIFLKPLDIARSLPSPAWIFGAWVVIGVVCLCGALAYAELGAMLPEAGGMYAFIREGWGRFPAFLYGWCLMLVTSTGAVAALSIAFASSLATLVPLDANAQIAVAVAMIVTLALVNHFGVRWGALLQNLSTSGQAPLSARHRRRAASSSTARRRRDAGARPRRDHCARRRRSGAEPASSPG